MADKKALVTGSASPAVVEQIKSGDALTAPALKLTSTPLSPDYGGLGISMSGVGMPAAWGASFPVYSTGPNVFVASTIKYVESLGKGASLTKLVYDNTWVGNDPPPQALLTFFSSTGSTEVRLSAADAVFSVKDDLTTTFPDGTHYAKRFEGEEIQGTEFVQSQRFIVDGCTYFNPGAISTPTAFSSGVATLTVGGKSFIRMSSTSAQTIYGIAVTGEQLLYLVNVGSYKISLAHESGSAGSATQRILCPNNATLVIRPNGGVMLWRDNTDLRWRVIAP